MKRTVLELEGLDEQCSQLLDGGDRERRSLVPQEAADYVSKVQPMVKELHELWSLEEYLSWVLRVRRLRYGVCKELWCVCVCVRACARACVCVYKRDCVHADILYCILTAFLQ